MELSHEQPTEVCRCFMKDIVDWAERYRAIWEQRLDRLDSYLKHLTSKEKKNARQQRRK